MKKLTKSLVTILFLASCSFATAETTYGTVSLSTSYDVSISGWSQLDEDTIYVPAHSTLTVTDYDLQSDTIANMYLQQQAALYIDWTDGVEVDVTYVNDSDEGRYYSVQLESAVYTDPWDVIYAPASSASVSYKIDTND